MYLKMDHNNYHHHHHHHHWSGNWGCRGVMLDVFVSVRGLIVLIKKSVQCCILNLL